jgi:hypothetical protein
MVWADSLEQVTLCHPIMPVANGLGSGFVRIDDGQLGKRDGPTRPRWHGRGCGLPGSGLAVFSWLCFQDSAHRSAPDLQAAGDLGLANSGSV